MSFWKLADLLKVQIQNELNDTAAAHQHVLGQAQK
jgi:hypothetical protein